MPFIEHLPPIPNTFKYQKTLNQLKQSKESFILLGDYNLDWLKYNEDSDVSEFADMNFEQRCVPLITKPTRIDTHSASCIDNIIMSNIFPCSEAGILLEDISDHFPIIYVTTINPSVCKQKLIPSVSSSGRRNFSLKMLKT